MTENRQNNQVGYDVPTQPRTISSSSTLACKVIMPIVQVLFFPIGWFIPLIRTILGAPFKCECASSVINWIYLITWIIGIPLFLFALRIKRVRIDNDFLYVSNYRKRKEITVPLNMVRFVSEIGGHRTYFVNIHFHSPTKFGEEITFLPKARFGSFDSHPIVGELLKAAGIQNNNIAT